jgi:hypothetical protein
MSDKPVLVSTDDVSDPDYKISVYKQSDGTTTILRSPKPHLSADVGVTYGTYMPYMTVGTWPTAGIHKQDYDYEPDETMERVILDDTLDD